MPLAPFVVLCVLSVLGSVGNVFILAAVCLRHKLRVRGNMFVVNLALADLLVTAYIMPMGLVTLHYDIGVVTSEKPLKPLDQITLKEIPITPSTLDTDIGSMNPANKNTQGAQNTSKVNSLKSEAKLLNLNRTMSLHGTSPSLYPSPLCQFNAFLALTACLVSAHSLLMIGVERYVHICRTRVYNKVFTDLTTGITIGISWAYAGFLGCQGWTGWVEFRYHRTLGLCMPSFPLSFGIWMSIFCIFIPWLVLAICYWKIYRVVQASRSQMLISHEDAAREPRRETFKRIQWLPFMLSSLVLSFIIFWGPFGVVILIIQSVTIPNIVFPIAVLLVLVNSCVNSILYGVLNTNFSKEYRSTLHTFMAKFRTAKDRDSSGQQKDVYHEGTSHVSNRFRRGPTSLDTEMEELGGHTVAERD